MGNINLQGGVGRFGMLTADETAPDGFVTADEVAADLWDPADYNVDDVNDYLADADEDEYERVMSAERAGKARVGIIGS